MEESVLGLYIFIAISALFSLIAHWKIKNFWVALFASTLLAVISFQVLVYMQLGHLDPFYPIAVLVSGLIALAISSAIGGIFKHIRSGSING
jgi:MFS superfamily sulfate permease-like transporter